MTYRCSISQLGPLVGNKVSHANNKTKMRQLPNLQQKAFYSSELKRKVRIRISNRLQRTIDKNGLAAVLKDHNLSIRDLT